MKKGVIFAITLGVCFLVVQFSFISIGQAQYAVNSQGDLYGENLGDQIVLDWRLESGATGYIVYQSTTLTGPWTELSSIRASTARTGKVHITPDAKLMDLCYKVEAIDAGLLVIRTYEPICVPKFVQ